MVDVSLVTVVVESNWVGSAVVTRCARNKSVSGGLMAMGIVCLFDGWIVIIMAVVVVENVGSEVVSVCILGDDCDIGTVMAAVIERVVEVCAVVEPVIEVIGAAASENSSVVMVNI